MSTLSRRNIAENSFAVIWVSQYQYSILIQSVESDLITFSKKTRSTQMHSI